ncbi:hypothetical protein QE152_g12506 [Popillia japonica]|uniref:C2H2-type domain-containing protein n=1 Tax=Popillia japonica TaxID=7064 RepID=A0AAW1LNV7_POPJA
MQKYKLYKTVALSDTHLSDDASTASTSTIVGETNSTLLHSYNNENRLSQKQRNLLVDVLIKEAINDTGKLVNEDFDNLSRKICDLFPTETKPTYYIPYVPKENSAFSKPISAKGKLIDNKPISAKGKLIDKYRNLQRIYKYIDNVEKIDNKDDTQQSREAKESFKWLKENSEPWSDVSFHWKRSYILRKSKDTKTVAEYMNDWPILSHNDALILIEEDFNSEHTCGNALLGNWEEYFNKIVTVKKQQEKSLELINLLNTEVVEDARTVIQFYILANFLPPRARIQKKKGYNWKPSTEESKESFIHRVNTVSEVHISIDKKREKATKYGVTVQPYVLAVGPDLNNIISSYLVIDRNVYKVQSMLKAIDICFKTYRALHLQYPLECEQIWLFLQKAIYGISTPCDKKIPICRDSKVKMFICPSCKLQFKVQKHLFLHMKWKHSYDSVFHCRQGQCDRMYSNIYSYQRHMLMKHVSDFNAPLNESDKIPFHSTSVNNAVFSCENVFIEPKFADNSGRLEKDSSIINTTLEMFSKVLHTSALQFVSKLYSQYNLPRNIVQQFVNDVSLMFSNASQNILQCKLFSISESEKSSDLIEIQNMISLLQEPFHMFETEHARFKYFQESGTFVKPESFVIDDEPILANTDNRIQFDNKKHMASFICPSLTLKAFLELPNVFQNITEYVNSLTSKTSISNIVQTDLWKNILITSKTSISNIVQTDLWKNILKHFPAKIVFPISLYFDDFELNNPLGTHAGTYKVGAVYYSIPCLPPQYVSQLENIFLAQLHHTADLQKYDNTRVFSRLLRSFKQLEQNGIVISVDNLETNVYFIVILILGDNLGIHKMFGFHESFNSNNYCRFCRASKTVAATQITEHDATIRTVENYNVDLYDNQCGIKDDCIFNELQHFHCVLNTGVDIMHDIYEGICRYDIGHILSYYIYEKRYFTINHLNHNLKCFNFCNENKPPLISEVQVKKKYIMFSASEMKSFIRVFGVLIGEFIPVNDLVWDLYKLLRQICEIVEQNLTIFMKKDILL